MRPPAQIGFEHRTAQPQGVPAGALAEVDLDLIDPGRDGIARAHRLAAERSTERRQRRPRDAGDADEGGAEVVAGMRGGGQARNGGIEGIRFRPLPW